MRTFTEQSLTDFREDGFLQKEGSNPATSVGLLSITFGLMVLNPGRLVSLSAIFIFVLTTTIQAQSIQEYKKIVASETNYSNYNYGSMIATNGQIGIVAAPGYYQFINNNSYLNTLLSGTIYFLKRDNNGQWTTAGNYVNNPIADVPIFTGMSVAANSTNLFAVMALTNLIYYPVVQVFGFDPSDGHPIVLKTLEMGYLSSQPRLPIAVSGDNLIVGNPPSFFIYNRNQGGPDNWGLVKSFTVSAFEPANLEVDKFGCSTSIDGTTAIVGAPDKGNGVVYIYSRDEGGLNNWGQVKTLVAPDGVPGDRFGEPISISNDVIVASSVGDDDQGSNSGSAYLYYKDQGGVNNWGFVKKITAADGAANDQFGQALSLNGDILSVGAPGDDDSGVDAGSAYVFSRNQDGNDNWGLVTKMLEHSGAAGDAFGSALSSDANEILVGSPKADFSGINSGSLEIHNKSVNGPDDWGLVRTMGPSTGSSTEGFGSSMSFDGDYGVVATTDNNRLNPIPNTVPSTGVYLYNKDQGGLNNWGTINKIPPSADFNPGAVSIYGGSLTPTYGASCAIANPVYHSTEPGGLVNEGEVRIYSQNEGGRNYWGLAKKIGAGYNDNQTGFFGNALAMNGGILAVSAFRTASGQAGDTKGKVLIFDSNMSWGLKNIIVAPDAAIDDYFGSALAISESTLAISSPFNDDMGSNSGSVYLYMKDIGGFDNWGYLKKITASDGSANDSFGASVDISSDFLVVGAYKDDASTGSIYIYKMDQGGTNSWGLLKKIQAPDKNEGDQFGLTVGVDENSITVGSLLGKTYVYLKDLGGTNNWGFSTMLVPTDFGALNNFGQQISVSDSSIFVSASHDDGTGTAGGAVYAFYKPGSSLSDYIPRITSFAPGSGPVGVLVTISGENFDPVPARNTVKFNEVSATVITASITQLTVNVPNNATTGTIVVVTRGVTLTSTSNFCVSPSKPTITANLANPLNPILTSSSAIGNQWFMDGTAISGATNTTLSVTTPGTYTVQVTAGCPSPVSDGVTFCVSPKPTITANLANPSNPILTSSSAIGNQWFMDGTVISGATNTTLSVTTPGTYTVQVTAGCPSPVSEGVTYLILGDIDSPGVLGIRVYPVPAGEWITIDMERLVCEKVVMLEVYNQLGQRVHDLSGEGGGRVQLPIGSLSNGMYVVRARQLGKTFVDKFIKR